LIFFLRPVVRMLPAIHQLRSLDAACNAYHQRMTKLPFAVVLAGLVLASSTLAQSLTVTRTGEVEVERGVRIHYAEAGDRAAKTTLLFVPGWSMSSAVWRDQLSRFASTARVVAIDPRSQGASTITTRSNTPERRAQDLREVIRSLGLTNVVLVGWSQGVQDAAAYAAAFNGESIAGYVLVDAAISAGPAAAVAQPDALKQQLEQLALYSQFQRQYLRGMMNAIIRSAPARQRIDEYVEIGLATPPDLGISMLMLDFIAVDRRAAMDKFNRPTLVVAAAESDELEAQRDMAHRIKNARLELIADAGHAVFLDQPERFNDLLADFVRRTASGSP
jgi:non-heme chloroperoxidase